MDTIKKIDYKGYEIHIVPDDFAEDPREWDNLSKFCFAHKRYSLPNELDVPLKELESWSEVKEWIRRNYDVLDMIPVRGYSHGSLSVSTSFSYPYNCPWDSGMIGFVVLLKKDVRENWGTKRITQTLRDKAIKIAESEVKTYDSYLRGDVYGYRIIDPKTEEEIDSCYGFYGTEDCIQEAKGTIDYTTKAEEEANWLKLATMEVVM